ncbi:MAG: undecaprenyldiphospho-muramoylpentapeptide beta-N-acetylglucosaminyltransferase [Bacteroidia bacterium]|nr:MAG: undecaprenyldiphospho-muramoylpentapeptide beta-N-acetylglucosaminyltransferase [Bacteroidia bacterium]
MSKSRPYRILIGGGGTGGHVFPAIAIADELRVRDPETEFLFVGALGKLEMEKVPEAGYPIEGLPVAGFQRRVSVKNLTFFYKLLVSMILSRRIVRRFHPDVAVGVGGYASGPILKAAARKGIPILIQEQNSYAGVTNRLLARSARVICVAYEKMDRYFPAEKLVITGNPVRQQVVNLKAGPELIRSEFNLEKGKRICLMVGGSLGARTLNRSFLTGLNKLDREDLQVLWQCGRYYHDEVEKKVSASGLKNVRVLPFINRMDLAYQAADIIISRAGAISISELCLVGKPVILVPSPNVAGDHQTHNAEALVEKSAALMVSDSEAEEHLVDLMLGLMGDDKLKEELCTNIKQLGIPDASQRISAEVLKILEEK